jgi:hypothetical protein
MWCFAPFQKLLEERYEIASAFSGTLCYEELSACFAVVFLAASDSQERRSAAARRGDLPPAAAYAPVMRKN